MLIRDHYILEDEKPLGGAFICFTVSFLRVASNLGVSYDTPYLRQRIIYVRPQIMSKISNRQRDNLVCVMTDIRVPSWLES